MGTTGYERCQAEERKNMEENGAHDAFKKMTKEKGLVIR
jgi:hypothetical protein